MFEIMAYILFGALAGTFVSLWVMNGPFHPRKRRSFKMYGITREGERPHVLGLRVDQVGDPEYINKVHPNGYCFRVYDVSEAKDQPYGR